MKEMIDGEVGVDLSWVLFASVQLVVLRADLSCRQLEMWESKPNRNPVIPHIG